jgi:hypothetical protein
MDRNDRPNEHERKERRKACRQQINKKDEGKGKKYLGN